MTVKGFKLRGIILLAFLVVSSHCKIHAIIKNFAQTKKIIIKTKDDPVEKGRGLHDQKDEDEDLEEESVVEASEEPEEGMGKHN